ncbi:hypothetical protein JK358_37035 [Nocardia sp. 2]|uniref:Uncharacterized protein n=1 Tax=Nocardia acididurans TaxID=2802282 RepID=A0ABS1MIC1_9NOCA|nr:hypothetical protein [Nocardia acididurans]MBL1080016.1 hypothetical protein [Nocardia acididurans]
MDALRRTTGIAATAGAGLTLVELPLYFVYGGPPPDWNILTRSLIGLCGVTALVVFMSCFGQWVKRDAPQYEWIGALAATAGIAWLTVTMVSTGLEVGAAIQAPEPIDPTISVSGTYILYGTISRLLGTVLFAALGFAVLRTRILPDWVGRSALMLAIVNLIFAPSLFFGNDPVNFYAANGWGTTATVGGITMIWLLAVGITILRSPVTAPEAKSSLSRTKP